MNLLTIFVLLLTFNFSGMKYEVAIDIDHVASVVIMLVRYSHLHLVA